MANVFTRLLLKFLLTAVGIVLVAGVPALFDGMALDFPAYITSIGSLFTNIFDLDALNYTVNERDFPLFPKLWSKWGYSMILLIVAFFMAFIVSLLLTYGTMLLPQKVRDKISFMLLLLESIPDVLIIGLFTIIFLSIYKSTGVRIFNIVAFGDDRIYVLPIVVLTILPILLFYRIMMHDFEDELNKSYVDLAKSRGLNDSELLFNHVLRNAIISIFAHSKSILWFMLSNLLLIEYVFNLAGLMRFMFDFYSPEVLTVGLLLIFVPIYMMQAVGQILIEKVTEQRIEI
ncbi:MAG TPA: ABC transporter permease subunit [Virgibacillus sp.]|nr:ABC transporter permease subunit [Virgibacillus sp.]